MRLGVAAAVVDGELVPGDVEVDRGTGIVRGVGLDGAGTGTALPGFVDLQVNGMAGVDFLRCGVDGFGTAGEAMLAAGVTAYQPTLVTAPEQVLVQALSVVASAATTDAGGPRILGAHLEGPFLSPARLGAHEAEHRRDPDLALLDRLLAAGPVRQVTLASELPGGLDLVRRLAPTTTVSLGHSDATALEAAAAFDAGATTVTHLFNAMRAPTHRDPGLAYAALARADVAVQLIVDGHHLAPETVLVAWRAAAGRTALVTDAISVAGLGEGERVGIGDRTVSVRDGGVRLADGTLAGSALTMDQALRNLVALGVPLAQASMAVSTVPARIARAVDLGRLAPGARADVTVVDDHLRVVRTLVAGHEHFAVG